MSIGNRTACPTHLTITLRLPRSCSAKIVKLNLVFHQEGTGLVIVADLGEFHFVGHGRSKPSAPDYPNFAAAELQFRDIVLEPHYVIDAQATHTKSSMKSSPVPPRIDTTLYQSDRMTQEASWGKS